MPVLSGVHGGDWIACDMVSPGMSGRCIVSIVYLLAKSGGNCRRNCSGNQDGKMEIGAQIVVDIKTEIGAEIVVDIKTDIGAEIVRKLQYKLLSKAVVKTVHHTTYLVQ